MKACTKCKLELPVDQFCKNNKRKDGLQAWCKPCARAASKASWEKRMECPQKRETYLRNERARHLKRTFGITLDEYAAMLEKQGGRCAICGTTEPGGSGVAFAVDHCHTTGAVRGLLCKDCNTGIGLLKDDFTIIENAITYLRRATRPEAQE